MVYVKPVKPVNIKIKKDNKNVLFVRQVGFNLKRLRYPAKIVRWDVIKVVKDNRVVWLVQKATINLKQVEQSVWFVQQVDIKVQEVQARALIVHLLIMLHLLVQHLALERKHVQGVHPVLIVVIMFPMEEVPRKIESVKLVHMDVLQYLPIIINVI